MQRALDLANAVATHLDAVGTASRQAGSPLGQSTYCFTYAYLPSQAPPLMPPPPPPHRARLWSLPRPLLQGPQPLCGIPTKEDTPFGTPRRAGTLPRDSARLP